MKYFRSITLLLVLAIAFSSFSLAESKKKTEKKEIKAKNIQYVISVKQKGKPIGEIIFETYPGTAPKMCRNFDSLVSKKFYDGTAFHRVIPGFMIQGGDPNSKNKLRDKWGQGDMWQRKIPAEFSTIKHTRGIVSTAREGDDINSGNSQFFIMVADKPHLDGKYTVFGKTLKGMDVADKIVAMPRDKNDNPNDKVEMTIRKK